MRARFWGVRGSIACPGPDTVIYGGNTACIELRVGPTDRLLIIDAGSGIRPLGDHLIRSDLPKGLINTEIFLTHTHWDHIMGFPFFTPIYIPGVKLKVYGPVTYEEDPLDHIVGDLLRYRYFPLRHSELSAEIEYHQLGECRIDLGDGITLMTKFLNHPLLCLGFRFEYEDKVFCTVYDTEPFRNIFPTDPNSPDYDPTAAAEGDKAASEANEKIIDFARNADVLVHDAQYTRDEYLASREGWGHSSFEHAIDTAIRANARKVVLFHHDPVRTDKELRALENHHRALSADKHDIEIIAAKEGMVLEF
ncbi:MAG: MBL fold metallo-hydrolase [Desulfobacterales bacterium]|nr:MBL fold metallo-hydrolase [Desulfobacterales bacterium]